MNTTLFDSIARIARHEARARAVAGVGKVVDIFPADGAQPDHAVTVEMRDSGLVLPHVPVAVGVMGLAAIPAVGDLVVVVYLEGDYNAPIVVGRLYHPDQNPPRHTDGQIVLHLPSGETDPKLKLDVVGAQPSITLELPGEVKIEVVEGKVHIAVGAMHVNVEGSGGGRAEIAAGNSQITLKQDGDITITAAGNLKLAGTEVAISGSAKVKIQGATVEVN